ncbi:hypothetical protein Tco_0271847, partial [Tanacetum coccineum]
MPIADLVKTTLLTKGMVGMVSVSIIYLRYLKIVTTTYLLTYKLYYNSRTRAEQSLVRWATPQLHDMDALANTVDPPDELD